MPIQYKSSKHALIIEGENMTEQEHKDSCDINKMVKSAARGLQVRGSSTGPWADGTIDDLTIDRTQLNIQKQHLEAELTAFASQNELSPDELKHVPSHVQKRFGFKAKKPVENTPPKNANDLTNANSAETPPQTNPSQKNP